MFLRRLRRVQLASLVAAPLACVLAAGCKPISTGLWSTFGTDARLGAFTATLEIRDAPGGGLDAIRVARLVDRAHSDGRSIETAWTGRLETAGDGSLVLRFDLTRADFIPGVGSVVRGEADRSPLAVTAAWVEGNARALALVYTAPEDPSFRIDEQGSYVGVPAAEPVFRADREVRATHPAPGPFVKDLLFDAFASYHALPQVAPWVSNPEFQRAVHTMVVERTDFDFYRANPDCLRVVNKVVDEVSIAETEIRANAFRAPFHDKAAYYQSEVTSRFLGPHGMVENRDSGGNPRPDGDGALWTGVYAYTQVLRARGTGDGQAIEDVRAVVRGVHTLMDITGDPRNFARTLRLAGPPAGDGWVRGTGAFSHLDWLQGGNNDMAHGVLIGLIAGWDALPADDPLRPEIASHALALLDLCEFMKERAPECGPRDGLDLPSGNPGSAMLLAGIANDRPDLVSEGLEWMRDPFLTAYAGIGGGPFYLYGVSDWSGNHLTLVGTLSLQWLLARSGDADLEAMWREASGQAWRTLRNLEHPLHAALAAGLGALADPAERAEAASQAVWGLRSFAFPKHSYPADHTIRDDFVLSPFPSLPWKLDWETNPGRMQSLVGHGLVEHVVDEYFWNGSVFSMASGALGPGEAPGVDYLFLYWLARDLGLIGPGD